MYTGRPWTMRQYAGFGTAKESNERYHQLVAGRHRRAVASPSTCRRRWATTPTTRSRTGEVGKVGVAIDSLDDMRVLFEAAAAGQGVDVDDDQRARLARCCCSTSWSPRSRASPATQLNGTIQNDVLKEYIARGTYIYPPKQSLRLITDIFAYCHTEMPRWNTISISGYHMAEAGATPAQEIAFTLANGKRVRPGGAGGRPGRRRLRAAAVVLLRRPHHPARGDREVPRGPADLGPHHARRVRRQGPQVPDAALPHPDGRRAADRAAARGQPGPGRAAGPRRGPRWHPVAAHQLLRRGDRPADREGRPAGAAHPAGHRLRDRRRPRPSTRSPARTSSSR